MSLPSMLLTLVPRLVVLGSVAFCGAEALAQSSRSSPPDLRGVFQVIPDGTALPGGMRNTGSPADITLLPAAAAQAKTTELAGDPAKMCQPIGPIRMMARADLKFELVPVLSKGLIVMLFEDLSRGHVRQIFLNRGHPDAPAATWHGDSVARWEGETLVIDTVGLNDRTWLNDAGAQHSEALHLIERLRLVAGGKYLEYRMTAEDPKALAKPLTYTRYFERIRGEIGEDICEP